MAYKNSEKDKLYRRKYREEHREKAKEYSRKYYQENKEKMRECNKKYHKEHPERVRECCMEYNKKHLEEVRGYKRKYCEKNPEKRKESKMKWIKKHPEYNMEYHKKHPEKVRESSRKRRNTLKGSIDNRIGPIITSTLKGEKRGRRWETLVGYTVEDLRRHIQNRFTQGMTWVKFMSGEIHIDHIVPKSHFKYITPEDPQFKECWGLHNLQPLWAKENMSKGNRIYQLPLILNQ